MKRQFLKIVACAGLVALTGCASTPMPTAFANHFNSAKEDQDHSKCMAENAMFNNRQLMVAPGAVQNAWNYCVKQADVWYPGKGDDARKSTVSWESR